MAKEIERKGRRIHVKIKRKEQGRAKEEEEANSLTTIK